MTTAESLCSLHLSPFWVLGVSARDDRRHIVQKAEERSIELDPEICQRARSELTSPRTRVAAEIGWLPGLSPARAAHLADCVRRNPGAVRSEQALPTLARVNLLAAAFESLDAHTPRPYVSAFLQELASLVDKVALEEVVRDINEDRMASGFPQIASTEQVETELATESVRCVRL